MQLLKVEGAINELFAGIMYTYCGLRSQIRTSAQKTIFGTSERKD